MINMKNEKMQLKEQKKQLMDEYQFYKNADGECEGTIEGILTALGKTVIDLKELEESGPHTWCPQCGKSMDEVDETDGMPVYECEECEKTMGADVIGEMKYMQQAERAQMASMER